MFEFHRNNILKVASKEEECFVRLRMLAARIRYETTKISVENGVMRKLTDSAMLETDRIEQISKSVLAYQSALLKIVSVYTGTEYRICSFGWRIESAGGYVIAVAAAGSLGQIRSRIQNMGCIRF